MHDIVANSTDQRRSLNSFHRKRGVDVIHCVCHRLALILSDAIKGTKAYDPVIPDAVINLLNWLHTYFAKSPKRKNALRMLIDNKNLGLREERARGEREGRRFPLPLITVRNPDDALEEVLDHRCAERQGLMPLASIKHDTSFGAYANKFLSECCGATGGPTYGTRLSQAQVLVLKKQRHKFFSHCIVQIDERFPLESCELFELLQGMHVACSIHTIRLTLYINVICSLNYYYIGKCMYNSN